MPMAERPIYELFAGGAYFAMAASAAIGCDLATVLASRARR